MKETREFRRLLLSTSETVSYHAPVSLKLIVARNRNICAIIQAKYMVSVQNGWSLVKVDGPRGLKYTVLKYRSSRLLDIKLDCLKE